MDEKPLFFVGIDPSQRYQPYVFAVLNDELKIQVIGAGPLREVLAYLAGLGSACVAINGPQMLNQGLVNADEDLRALFPLPASKSGDLRKVELHLIQEGIQVVPTPATEAECMVWQRRGLKLYRKIARLGYHAYPDDQKRLYVEAPALAVFNRLNGGNRIFEELSLEGRLQRQLILFEQGFGVKDAMNFFEEVTRFRLMKGILPDQEIYQPGELNAMACAYLAWLLYYKPDRVISTGDPLEGKIYLPALH